MLDTANTIFSSTVTDQDIRLSPAASQKMAELLGDVDEQMEGIRVFVTGGGCSGMNYGITYADSATEYDCTLEGEGYRVLVDAVALNYLRGCEIDFDQNSFIFKNVFQAVGGSGVCGGCMGGNF